MRLVSLCGCLYSGRSRVATLFVSILDLAVAAVAAVEAILECHDPRARPWNPEYSTQFVCKQAWELLNLVPIVGTV